MTTEDAATRKRNALKVAAFYTFIGPLLGIVFVAVPISIVAMVSSFGEPDATVADVVASGVSVTMLSLLLGYVLGFVPAMVTGIAAAIQTNRSGYFSYAFVGSVALIAAVVWSIVFGYMQNQGTQMIDDGAVTTILIPSLFAAVVGRAIIRRLGWIS